MPRLFIALYPPPALAAAWLDRLAVPAAADLRPTPAPQIHMTLQFVGEVTDREVAGVEEVLEHAASGIDAFDLRPERLATFPLPGQRHAGTPRLVAVLTDRPPALMELHRRLAARLARPRRGRLDVEKDRFTPHLTLARFATPVARPPVDAPLEGPAAVPFRVDAAALMRSVLRPAGAEHVQVHRVALHA